MSDSNYYSFKEKPNCDKFLSITASVITISCIIGYFIYLATR